MHIDIGETCASHTEKRDGVERENAEKENKKLKLSLWPNAANL